MILFSKLGQHGRFANQLFQVSFMEALSKKTGILYQIPQWKYSKYFINDFPETTNLPKPADAVYKEGPYKYQPDLLQHWSNNISATGKDNNIDILGYFQHLEYLEGIDYKQLFQFKQEYINYVFEKHAELFTRETIFVGIRRTDYVTKPGYYQLTPLYYILSLQKLNYKDKNIVFISDDLEWCKFHFQSLPNAFFPEFEEDIFQFICGTFADNWIIANSTFHFWSALLSNAKKVIQPNHLFADHLLKNEGDVNFYIENDTFEIFEHEGKKIDLKDTTFTIPVHFDHKDRKDNLELSICLLQQAFDTNIIVGEQGGDKFEYTKQFCKYMSFGFSKFHRTKMLNELAGAANTPIVVNYDADVCFPPMQLLQAVELLRENKAEVVYPYEYLFNRIPRVLRQAIFPSYDLAVYTNIRNGVDTASRPSVGGCVLFDKHSFFEGGGENENFVAYNPEDVERFERFQKLGYRIVRVKGHLYHFDHHVGPNSSMSNPDYNVAELEKVRKYNKQELKEYINTWPWLSGYTNQYYEDISDGGAKSSVEVFSVLPMFPGRVIDYGCGLGQWSIGANKLGWKYTGVDFGVPKEKLMIDDYIDHDLRKPFKPQEQYDLAVCVEVAEHLDKRYAPTIVETLCNSAPFVLFSAAIPGQGGLQHYNEQYQSYWVELFKNNGYYLTHWQPREKLLTNKKIDYWYRQNILMFSNTLTDNTSLDPYLDYIIPHNLR